MIGSEFSKYYPMDSKEYQEYLQRRNAIIDSWACSLEPEIYDVHEESTNVNVYDSGFVKNIVKREIRDLVEYVMPEDQIYKEVLVPTRGWEYAKSNDLSHDVETVAEQNAITLANEVDIAEDIIKELEENKENKLKLLALLGLGILLLR